MGRAFVHCASDLWVRDVSVRIDWPAFTTQFTRVYDEDTVQGASAGDSGGSSSYDGSARQIRSDRAEVRLGSHPSLPYSLHLEGTIHRDTATVVCDADVDGCTGVSLKGANFKCNPNARTSQGPLQVAGSNAVLRIVNSTFQDCHAIADGGSVRATNGVTIHYSAKVKWLFGIPFSETKKHWRNS